MTPTRAFLYNLALIIALTFLACGFQSSFWFELTGAPAPQIWMNIALYLVLYRKFTEAIFVIYGIGLVASGFTATPLGILWPTLLIVSSLTSFVKSRFFWPTTRYFIMASFAFTAFFHITYWVVSRTLEHNPARFSFFQWLVEVLLSGLTSPLVAWTMHKMDRLTHREPLPESSGVTS